MIRWVAFAAILASPLITAADSSGPRLAGYYDGWMAICGGVAVEWVDDDAPRRSLADVVQVGVGRSNRYALRADGVLHAWSDDPSGAKPVLEGVRWFTAGRSGVFAIRSNGSLWHLPTTSLLGFGESLDEPARRIADDVATAAIGDSADFYVTRGGQLHVKGRAHRGQYGDGRLTSTDRFVVTAEDVVQVVAHTGHALIRKSDDSVWGTGGNIYGPLGQHGYGDKAIRWGRIFEGASAVATGSSHTVAIDGNGVLWIWGRNEGLEPRRVMDGVTAVAAGTSATVAIAAGSLWQWDTGATPRRVMDCP